MRYRIVPVDPNAHLFEVELRIERPDTQGQRLAMPAWTPGSYLIRDFARNVVAIEARSPTGDSATGRSRHVPLRKLDKATWQAAPAVGALEIVYRVYAWDLSVRAAHLDSTHGFFNGPSVFLRVIGQEDRPCELRIEPPPQEACPDAAEWRVATTLRSAGAGRHGFGRYRAADYDELTDHPVEMGRFTLASFESGGARHEIAITGRHDADTKRLCRDLARVCAGQIRLFEPRSRRAPVDRYLFQVLCVGNGYGGLEHRSSTSLICSRDELPHIDQKGVSEGYRSFLGLASHEYFHLWNVKRIRPAAFAEHDLQSENYTRLLWIFEGFTSYYDDLMLVRSGVIDHEAYLASLVKTIGNVLRGPGRHLQSVAESSFDAWVKYYRQDENSPNAIVSYYAKGSLVALALDLTIRARSSGRHSLDDVMRAMWQQFGRRFFEQRGGLAEDAFPRILEQAVGMRLDAQVRRWSYGTGDLPLAALLRPFGVRMQLGTGDQGPTSIGAKVATREGALTIVHAYSGQAAERAGLSAGDTLVALDGLRMDERALKAQLARRRPGEKLRVHAFRLDELIEREIELDTPPAVEATLAIDSHAGARAARLREQWLGAARKPPVSRKAPARPRRAAAHA